MELIHPRDLALWRERRDLRGQTGRLLRRLRGGAADEQVPVAELASIPGDDSGTRSTLVVLEDLDDRSMGALLAPLPYLRGTVHCLVVGAQSVPTELASLPRSPVQGLEDLLEATGAGAVLTAGGVGSWTRGLHEEAIGRGVTTFVLQTGQVTPFSPPLPENTTVVAWTDADAALLRSGRHDVDTMAIGSQRLWELSHDPVAELQDGPPVLLARLADDLLPRHLTTRAAASALRHGRLRLRPDVADTDPISRASYELWRRRGAELVEPRADLRAVPLVGVRQEELLEAAVRGVPVRVHAPGAPAWLQDLWDRTGMRRSGGPGPSRPSPQPSEEPATVLAETLDGVR